MSLPRHPDVRVVASQTLAAGRAFDVVREELVLPSGLRQELLLIDHPGAVVVLAENQQREIAVVRQYRHAIGAWLSELPAGRIERGEDRLAAAQRELDEEVGVRATHWLSLGCFFPAPGFCSEQIEIFWARGITPSGAARRAHDADEEIAVAWRPPAEAEAELAADGKSIVAIARWRAAAGL
jgi:ADP-ribose pyrophosphatase